ncbi:MAG: glycosyltransferase family 39 protein [Candidatus Omnitrophota bacterium]
MLLVLVLAFAVRLSAILALGRHISPELWEYDTIALNILKGEGYIYHGVFNTDYRSFGYPAYPYISAFFHYMTNRNYFILEMFQVVLSVGMCCLIYRIAKKIFDERTAIVSSLLVALHPGLIVYTTKIHELVLVAFLISLTFWLIISMDLSRTSNNVLIGLLIGFGTLTRPTLVFFLPVYILYVFASAPAFKGRLKQCLVVAACVFIAILPWTIRNYVVHKKIIFITTISAEQFWRGNNPLASGSALTPGGDAIINAAPKEFLDKLYGMDEIGQYGYFYGEAFKFIKSNPALFIKLTLKKFLYFWTFSPQTGMRYPAAWKAVYGIFYAAVLLFFAVGSWLAVKKGGALVPYVLSIFALLLFISAANSLYYVEMRHRWALELLMLIFSAYGAVSTVGFLRRNARW